MARMCSRALSFTASNAVPLTLRSRNSVSAGGIYQVVRIGKLLSDRKVKLDLTDAARAWLGRVGYDPVYGARPLKRAVQKYLQDPLADKILRGDVLDGSTIHVDEGDGGLVLK